MEAIKSGFHNRILTPYYRRRFYQFGEHLSVRGRIVVKGKVTIGESVLIEGGSQFLAWKNGEIKVGDHVFFNGGVITSTLSVELGNNIVVSAHALIIDHNGYGLDGNPPVEKPVKIGNHVWIGMRAIILKGVAVGDNSVIGAAAVVTKDVEPNTIVASNSAKKIRETSGFTLE